MSERSGEQASASASERIMCQMPAICEERAESRHERAPASESCARCRQSARNERRAGMSLVERSGTVAVRALLTDAADAYRDNQRAVDVLRQHLNRVDEPLRVAIAGKMKAGKSTLLNALVGEEIAPTDAGECTKVVTWYEYAATPRVSMQLDGGRTPARFRCGASTASSPSASRGVAPRMSNDCSCSGHPEACRRAR